MNLLRNILAPFRSLGQLMLDPFRRPEERGFDTYQPKEKMREVSQRGIDLIKQFEGCYLSAYKDSVGVWTIGYGHTGLVHRDGTVKAGRKITQEEAEALLRHDLRVFSKRVQDGTTVPLTDDQFAALVSFDFNTGGFLKSTLRKKLNAGLYEEAANQFLLWDKAGGKTLKGLTRRRRSERNLFRGAEFPIEKSV